MGAKGQEVCAAHSVPSRAYSQMLCGISRILQFKESVVRCTDVNVSQEGNSLALKSGMAQHSIVLECPMFC